MEHNKTIFPPQKPGEEKRPGYVCNMKKDIKYSPLKMWYVACFVRGMTVDEAIKQLSFLNKKGAAIAKEVILEAQNMAADHNIEFKSNLWVAESFATKGMVIKGMRRHAKGRQGIVHYRHCNYFVRLEEGKPPADYYMKNPKSGKELLDEWMDKMQHRKVLNSL
ncbi:39S ribosomal protein L22, mitochondrial [Dufourea novaeangliae]|uniref:Large ribosomal subunit protein uL22m n=2 Tax=Dufourea novaeangliae TaxID=178035 RepID=A0A154P4Z8_DUFNO|nr:39S ribosomal protein L22, mitochondrial [Dufourea novaeangliae]